MLAQDDRKLKRASRIEVAAAFGEAIDENALFDEALKGEGDLSMRIEEVNRRISEAQTAKPSFILA